MGSGSVGGQWKPWSWLRRVPGWWSWTCCRSRRRSRSPSNTAARCSRIRGGTSRRGGSRSSTTRSSPWVGAWSMLTIPGRCRPRRCWPRRRSSGWCCRRRTVPRSRPRCGREPWWPVACETPPPSGSGSAATVTAGPPDPSWSSPPVRSGPTGRCGRAWRTCWVPGPCWRRCRSTTRTGRPRPAPPGPPSRVPPTWCGRFATAAVASNWRVRGSRPTWTWRSSSTPRRSCPS